MEEEVGEGEGEIGRCLCVCCLVGLDAGGLLGILSTTLSFFFFSSWATLQRLRPGGGGWIYELYDRSL